MNTDRAREWLTLLAYATVAAACGGDDDGSTSTSASATTGMTSSPMTGADETSTGSTDPTGATASASESTTNPDDPSDTAGDESSGGGVDTDATTDGDTGGSVGELCTTWGQLVLDCYDEGPGYSAEYYAQICMDDLAAYADDPGCYEILLESYTCDVATDCKELFMNPRCEALNQAFEKRCV